MKPLTKREREVWEVYSECKDTVQILADGLSMTPNTFNMHLKSIRRKKNAVDSRDVVRIYYEEKIEEIKNPPSPPPQHFDLPKSSAKVFNIFSYKNHLKAA